MNKHLNSILFVIFFTTLLFNPTFVWADSIYTIKTDASITGETSAGGQSKKLVRSSNGDFHTVYTYITGANRQIFYSKSTDGGQTWTETQLTNDAYDQIRPTMAIDSNNNIYVAWHGKSANSTGFFQIRFIKFSNGSWSGVTDLTSGNYNQQFATMAVDSQSNVHIAWHGTTAGAPSNTQIRYIKYSNGGWGSITEITSNATYTQNRPFVAVDYNDNVHIVWYGWNVAHVDRNQVRYIKYSNGSWSGITEITNFPGDQNYTTMGVDSLNNIHLAWQYVPEPQTIDKRIYYVKYTASNSSWGAITDISGSGNLIGQWNPKMGIDSHNNLHVFWNGGDATATTFQVLYVKFDGNSWGVVQNLTPNILSNEYPSPIWFTSPIVKNVKTNVTKDGFAFVYASGTSFKFYASSDLAFDVATPPIVTSTSGQSGSAGDTTLSVSTDENSTCRYSTTPGTPYASMTKTFTTTGGTSHNTAVGVSTSVFDFYVRCFGPYTSFNTTDYAVNFLPPPSPRRSVSSTSSSSPKPIVSASITNTPNPTKLNITKDYKLKDKNEDIKLLQQWLNENGFTVSSKGLGSKGNETTEFGTKTKNALIKYQKSKGLPPTGYFGPMTRKSMGI